MEDSVLTFFILNDDAPVKSEYRGTLSATKDTLWLDNVAVDRGSGALPYVRPPDDEDDS